jgi:putative toxin-antitoxin system antitoxin component (TIGR02293 family)
MATATPRKPDENKPDINTGRQQRSLDTTRSLISAASPVPVRTLSSTTRTNNAGLMPPASSGLQAPGATLLGVTAATVDDLIETIARGLPTATLRKLSDSLGFNRRRVLELTGISERSLARRNQHARLTPAESERTARLARVTERAHSLMGAEMGNRWLNGHWPALNHKTPLQYAQSDLGAELVIDLMSALEDGIFV